MTGSRILIIQNDPAMLRGLKDNFVTRGCAVERSVDRCVTTLRAKIGDDPRHPRFIHTIRDIGYRFEEV